MHSDGESKKKEDKMYLSEKRSSARIIAPQDIGLFQTAKYEKWANGKKKINKMKSEGRRKKKR